MVKIMDIEQQIALALVRNERELAEELLLAADSDNQALVVNMADYVRPEKKQAEIGYLWA